MCVYPRMDYLWQSSISIFLSSAKHLKSSQLGGHADEQHTSAKPQIRCNSRTMSASHAAAIRGILAWTRKTRSLFRLTHAASNNTQTSYTLHHTYSAPSLPHTNARWCGYTVMCHCIGAQDWFEVDLVVKAECLHEFSPKHACCYLRVFITIENLMKGDLGGPRDVLG